MLQLSAYLAFRQLVHRGPSAIGGLVGVCVAIILMFMQLGFRNALYDSAVSIPGALDADIFLTAPQYASLAFSPPWLARDVLNQARAVPGVTAAKPLYAFSGQLRSPRTGGNMSAWILAFNPDQPVFTMPEINQQLDLIRLPESALMDRLSRFDYRILRDAVLAGGNPKVPVYQPGATLAPLITVTGLFSLGPSFTIDGLVVTSDLNFYRLLNVPLDRVSLGLVTVAANADLEQVKADLLAAVDGSARVMLRGEYIAAEKNFYATRTPIGMIFNLGLLVGVVVGIVFISQVLHGIVHANLREYAVLVAMGYRNSFFTLIVFEIASAIAIVTFIPSVVIAIGLYSVAGVATSLPLNLQLGSVVGVLGVVVLMGNLAALMTIRKLKKADPLDLFS